MTARLDPERTCYRCDGVFRTRSADRRVYCPTCCTTYGFPAPMVPIPTPLTATQVAVAEATRSSPCADVLTARLPRRTGWEVFGPAVRSGQSQCEAGPGVDRGLLFARTPVRRRAGGRDDA